MSHCKFWPPIACIKFPLMVSLLKGLIMFKGTNHRWMFSTATTCYVYLSWISITEPKAFDFRGFHYQASLIGHALCQFWQEEMNNTTSIFTCRPWLLCNQSLQEVTLTDPVCVASVNLVTEWILHWTQLEHEDSQTEHLTWWRLICERLTVRLGIN